MNGFATASMIVWALASLLAVVTILALGKLVVRMIVGDAWPKSRVRVPWRFSLMAVAVLIGVIAALCAFLRDSPELAWVASAIALSLWFPLARFLEFQQQLAQRRDRALADSLDQAGSASRASSDTAGGGGASD